MILNTGLVLEERMKKPTQKNVLFYYRPTLRITGQVTLV